MTSPKEFERFCGALLIVLLSWTFQGAYSELVVSPVGATLVNTLSGSSVTLAVSFSGASDPVVTWFMRSLPVGTWTLNSSEAPDIDPERRDVLKIEKDGSLTFVNVPLSYHSNYTVEMTKSGLGTAVTSFTLNIFEIFQDVTLNTRPDFAQEGSDEFMLHYRMLRGVVQQQMWFLNGTEIRNAERYVMEGERLVILRPNRSDSGEYAVLLSNPFSNVTAYKNISVRHGPDEPVLEIHPVQTFYVSGESLNLTCQSEGFPRPTVHWTFGGQILAESHQGVLSLNNVLTTQGGSYTCMLLNEDTKERREKTLNISIYERPAGSPTCSVQSVGAADLRYHCEWKGGTPQADLSFPTLNESESALGNFSKTLEASDALDGRTIQCLAKHRLENKLCNITARSPMKFVPSVGTTVDNEGKIVVTIRCWSEASPTAVVSWFRGGEALTGGSTYHRISSDTTALKIRHNDVSYFLQQNYSCTCSNVLGSRRREIQLQGPSISDSGLSRNQDGTVIKLAWQVPSTSVVTGFDIQMKGPDLLSSFPNATRTKGRANEYRTIQQKPGLARTTDIYVLDPKSTYRFRVVPKARLILGEPSVVHRIGPGGGLSGPAIAGIAAGIPCSLLFLLLLCCLIYFLVIFWKKKSHQTQYPVFRGVEKQAKVIQPDVSPLNLLNGGLESPPDYNRLHQTPSERSVTLPTFVPPPPVRTATTV